jgi:hypothetical protein
MNQTTNGSGPVSFSAQLAECIAQVDPAQFIAPSRKPSESDVLLGQATDSIKAVRTARALILAEIAPLQKQSAGLGWKINEMVPRTVTNADEFMAWRQKDPEAKALADEMYRIYDIAQPKLLLAEILKLTLEGEVMTAFPQSAEHGTGKVPRINNDWSVVMAEPKGHGGFADLFSGGGQSVIIELVPMR